MDSFLSTLPGRGAAAWIMSLFSLTKVFYPRSPGGERLSYTDWSGSYRDFSIHAPREGSGGHKWHKGNKTIFLSTLPGRGAAIGRRGVVGGVI